MKHPLMLLALAFGFVTVQARAAEERTIDVSGPAELRRALGEATPGTTIRIAAGRYEGGFSSRSLQGEPGRPILLKGADPHHPPVFEGGGNAFHLSGPSYLELHNLIITKATGNGLNIDDGGSRTQPAHHIKLRGLTVRDIGPRGNHDGFKLSGVDDFEVADCTFERWGTGGSGIDMVGCHRGEIVDCVFRFEDRIEANGVQTKGGSRDIKVRHCRFEHAGSRGVNLGGSTGRPFFRPEAPGYEAKDITVEDCVFVGSMAPIAFVGVDGAVVRHNTIYRPRRWGLRILQETRDPDFVPSRGGRVTDNLVVYDSKEMVQPVNIGSGTAPDTFVMERNAWYCLDNPNRSRPQLPIPESDGVYGTDPQFMNAETGDFQLRPGSPLRSFGRRPVRPDVETPQP